MYCLIFFHFMYSFHHLLQKNYFLKIVCYSLRMVYSIFLPLASYLSRKNIIINVVYKLEHTDYTMLVMHNFIGKPPRFTLLAIYLFFLNFGGGKPPDPLEGEHALSALYALCAPLPQLLLHMIMSIQNCCLLNIYYFVLSFGRTTCFHCFEACIDSGKHVMRNLRNR